MEFPFKRVSEAAYLSTEKSDKYRAILRFFYIQHERLKEFLSPEEIVSHLKASPYFSEYEIEELHNDLFSLVKWGNLTAQQESGKVKTVEEFKKKRYRYQITPYTVEFERMLIRFEQDSETFGGSLEKTQFERFYQTLKNIQDSSAETPELCAQHWDDLLTYFKKITQNTSDYFAYLRSEDASEHMKTDAFLLYKDQFTLYLRDFIIALQRTASAIQDVMIALSRTQMQAFFKKVAEQEEKVFRFEKKQSESGYLTELEETWRNVKGWFLGDETGENQYENVLHQTNEAIRRLTRIVQRLGERSQQQRSRKEDYLHLARWFLTLPSVGEAHNLSAVAFGTSHTKHLYSDHIPTDDIYLDVWGEVPMAHERMPKIREYREKTKASAMEDHQEQREKTMKEHLEKRMLEQAVIKSYRAGKEIKLEDLPIVEPFVRKLFLSWIGKAMARADHIIKTEHGDRIKVELDPARTITLRSKDGHLQMPAVTFYYLEKENAK
ncbi:TIGR02677 family protein [Cytobacillus sp. NCCP-133]|uniref:TIGR02677 family protein n=1 Tax=Cytobacillus sp. NCCP-133 TaxID=766848 RepID=UPI0022311C84|nr:TIGR02677 family protein [Cytobacillus sp. NCCP-133]GLB61452.1 TIGR02677 family protein [Cytobacillus sp. NCCP-133]